MSIFDRFTSKKGKESKAAPKGRPAKDEADKKAFANVPSGKEKPVAAETKPVSAKASKDGKQAKVTTPPLTATAGPANHILVRPLVTEKSTRLSSLRQYMFEVQPGATKVDVRNAVHQLYGVRPTGVTMTNLRGKVVRYGRTWGTTINRRKAIVTLPDGKSIDVFSS